MATKLFDVHFHIIDPKYPLDRNNGFLPDAYTAPDYLEELKRLHIDPVGGVVVSGSFQGYHQEYFKAAFDALGENYVGITQVKSDMSDQELDKLNQLGIRGIRFNIFRGLTVTPNEMKQLSDRVYDRLGWSTEFYLDLSKADDETVNLIKSCHKASVDHLGMMKCTDKLKDLLSAGVPVRVTGFGRIQYSRLDLVKLLPDLYQENPDGLMFGTDLPSTRARYRFATQDIELVKEAFEQDPNKLQKLFVSNGQNWYLK